MIVETVMIVVVMTLVRVYSVVTVVTHKNINVSKFYWVLVSDNECKLLSVSIYKFCGGNPQG